MINLIFFTILGLALFGSFIFIALQGSPKSLPDSSAVQAVTEIINLEGSSFANARRLLDDTDYQALCSNPDLRRLALRLRNDRRQLALMWISSLQNDLIRLWRFRRFLIQRGVPSSMSEELRTLQALLLSLVLLSFIRLSIRAAGPFALPRATRQAGQLVDSMSAGAALVLGRTPAAGWAEIERSWVKSAA
ncbi:MAG: hypothetical protein DMG31_21020 [Acidobacteria bacterium]|nr:MAG: hypothetical protein DMG31_21020 [Acidobacteriota bacterium]